jgi:multidrug resistance efflux pump
MKKLLFAIILIALMAGCGQANTAKTPTPAATPATKKTVASGASAQGYVAPVKRADLAFRSSGRVAQVLVAEGDTVKAGQPLVKLQDADLKAALAAAQAELKRAQNGARPEEIAQADANVAAAKSQLDLAQAELARYQNGAAAVQIAAAWAETARAAAELKVQQDSYDALVLGPGYGVATDANVPGRGLGKYEEDKREQLGATKEAYQATQVKLWQVQSDAANDLKALQSSVDVAKARADAAAAQLNLTKAGAAPEQIDALKARVAQAQAALDETTLLAPFDGTIAELNINLGEIASPGSRIASLADLTQWQVDTDDLSEVDIIGVQPGAEVTVKVDALPDAQLKGKVVSITPRSALKRGDVTYTVNVALTDADPRLKWGMTAFVDIKGK